MSVAKIKKDLRNLADPERKKVYEWFFKTGRGQYGEGDKFLGVVMPNIRKVAKNYVEMDLENIEKILQSSFHEDRMCALVIMTYKFKKVDEKEQKKIYNSYLKHIKKYVNNWDLVDVSAHKIVGEYLLDKDRNILYKLAKSKNLWERRVAIVATYQFIKNKELEDTLKISKILLEDSHDLIHKAVGWMLREAGKKDVKVLEKFLKKYYKKMPRTMLRYSIEKFPEKIRKDYLVGKI